MDDMELLECKYDELHFLLCEYNQGEELINSIHNVIQEKINEIPTGLRVAFRPNAYTTEWIINNFNFSNLKIAGIYDINPKCDEVCNIPVYNALDPMVADIIIITSYNNRKQIVDELKATNKRYIDIYDVLEYNNILLNAPLEKYKKHSHVILNHFWNKFKREIVSESSLKQLMTAACEAKDFYLLEELCVTYQNDYPFVKETNEKYMELCSLINQLISKRTNKKDIILYWIDAVPYKWRKYFKNINDITQSGLNFKNVYTCTPFTHQSLRAIFSGILPLSDYKASMEKVGYNNSKLIRMLMDSGYDVLHIGHDAGEGDPKSMEDKYLIHFDADVSCNCVLWETLKHLVASKKPVFYIAHFVVETHPPMISADQESLNYRINKNDYMDSFKVSSAYLDRRIKYYNNYYDNLIQIFMSDHGEHISEYPENYWMQNKLHAICSVVGKDIPRLDECRLFSYVKFGQLIKWILDPSRDNYESIFSMYSLFQDTDIYSEKMIISYIEKGNAEYALAYRGALDGKYKYAINGIGKEFFYRIENDSDIIADAEENIDEYTKLKTAAGTVFPDLSGYKKYEHVSEIYKALKSSSKK